jgi:archaellum biogenesis ATPase FlaH
MSITDDTKILKSLLNYQFFDENKNRLKATLFDDEVADVFQVLKEAHGKYAHDLSETDLFELWKKKYPVATRSEIDSMKDLIGSIQNVDPISFDIASDVIEDLWKREIGRKIAHIGLEITEGKHNALRNLEHLIEKSKESFMPDDYGPTTTKDIEELLEFTSDKNRWKFNLKYLHKNVYGIGPGEFGVIFATPETGKTACAVSFCAAPGGFCHQGAQVLYLGNEEKTDRTMLRVIQSCTNMTKKQILENPTKAREYFAKISDNIEMKDIQDWSLDEVEGFIEKMNPDVVILDQADKVHISGSFGASHERLRELYRRFRELAKRYECALLVVSQASAEAKGRTKLSPFEMEGSKIGKSAETDLILGIGKIENDSEEAEQDLTRYITVSKNKLSGWHGTIVCNIKPDVSRYVD